MNKKVGQKRYQESYETRESGGVKRKEYLDWDKLKGDRTLEFFSPIIGVNRFDIVPYMVRSDKHPLVHQKKMKKGDLDYLLDIWIHTYVGPENADVVCLKKNYGKPCPICEEVSRLYDEGDQASAKKIQAKRRVVYNLIPRDGEHDGQLMVFEVSHFLFEKELSEAANACVDGEPVITFAELEKDGKTVQCRVVNEKMTSGKRTNDVAHFKDFRFRDRAVAVPESILDEAVSFDAGINLMTYEEIQEYFYGGGTAEKQQQEDAPKQPPAKKAEAKEDSVEDEPPAQQKPAQKPSKKEEDEDINSCPSGHTFGKDGDKKPECAACKPIKRWEKCVQLTEGE